MNLMAKYCKQDVDLLGQAFRKLLPIIPNLPNFNLFRSTKLMIDGSKVCPNCGSQRLKSNGYRYTKTSSYQRLICRDCNTWSRVDIKGNNPRTL